MRARAVSSRLCAYPKSAIPSRPRGASNNHRLICQAVAGETREERGEGTGGGATRAILTPTPPSLPLFTDWQAAGEEEYDEEEEGEDAFALRRRR